MFLQNGKIKTDLFDIHVIHINICIFHLVIPTMVKIIKIFIWRLFGTR